MILAAKKGKQTLFLVRNALERGYGVAGRVDGAAHRLFVERLLGEDDGLTPAWEEVTFFTGKALRTASLTCASHMPHIMPSTPTVV